MNWILRFESVNYRSKVWLNGRPIGRNTGAYLPFEIRVPRSALKRDGTNRLVIRVDNRRRRRDFPPSGRGARGSPGGGWWNYGGIAARGLPAARRPRRHHERPRAPEHRLPRRAPRPSTCASPCATSPTAPLPLRMTGTYGARGLRARRQARARRAAFATFSARIRVRQAAAVVAGEPEPLHGASCALASRRAQARRLQAAQRHPLGQGRSTGALSLNCEPMSFRGVGLHEDDLEDGLRDRQRAPRARSSRRSRRSARPSSARTTRCTPSMHELADREGLMIWSEIPVYAVKTQNFKQRRGAQARRRASSSRTSSPTATTRRSCCGRSATSCPRGRARRRPTTSRRPTAQAQALDPTGPSGSRSPATRRPAAGRSTRRSTSSASASTSAGIRAPTARSPTARSCPSSSTSSAPAIRTRRSSSTSSAPRPTAPGPVEEKGTYEYQQDFVNYHLGVFASKPWLSGAIYWTMQEFRVRPNWDGGNPRPNPPIHEKGLLRFDGIEEAGVVRRPAAVRGDTAARLARSRARASRARAVRYPSPSPWLPRAPSFRSHRARPRARAPRAACVAAAAFPASSTAATASPIAFSADARELRNALAARGAVLEVVADGDGHARPC